MITRLTVEEKVLATINHLKNEDPGARISILKICKITGLNRANLYENHSALIQKIQSMNKSTQTAKPVSDNTKLRVEIKELKRQVKALTILCLDLKIQLEDKKKKD